MLWKSHFLPDPSLGPIFASLLPGCRCAYCQGTHLVRPVAVVLLPEPIEVTALCFSCRLEAVELGYQVLLPRGEVS